MPSNSSSCPRCGYQEMRDISFWKNENHICAHCGAYWKTVNSDSDAISYNQAALNEKPRTSFGKKPSAITDDFFEKDHEYKIDLKSISSIDTAFSPRHFSSKFSFTNVAVFAVAALTLVSLPQIGLFSFAGQAIQEQIAALDFRASPNIDTIVTASIPKKVEIESDLRAGEVRFSKIERGAQPYIVVDGMIRNISGDDTTSRPLLIVLLDKNGNEVQSWFYKMKPVLLEPGKIMRFRSTVKSTAYGAKSIRVVIPN